jgi:hypothetical protein
MSEKQRLLDTLFKTEGREHLNLKFFRGSSDDISPDALCREANSAIFQYETGLAEIRTSFGDAERRVIEIKGLIA